MTNKERIIAEFDNATGVLYYSDLEEILDINYDEIMILCQELMEDGRIGLYDNRLSLSKKEFSKVLNRASRNVHSWPSFREESPMTDKERILDIIRSHVSISALDLELESGVSWDRMMGLCNLLEQGWKIESNVHRGFFLNEFCPGDPFSYRTAPPSP